MADPLHPLTVAEAAHRALETALRLGFTGTVHVVRASSGVRARLEGVGVVAPVPTQRWGLHQTAALARLKAADTGQPDGAWEWIVAVRAGVPLAGLQWIGLDALA